MVDGTVPVTEVEARLDARLDVTDGHFHRVGYVVRSIGRARERDTGGDGRYEGD